MLFSVLAVIALIGGSALLSGCKQPEPESPEVKPKSEPKDAGPPKCPEGPDPKLGFTEEDHPMAYSFYQQITKEDICLHDLDKGYRVTNHNGIFKCPSIMMPYCTQGADDGVISSDEVLEYTFNNDEKYRRMIEVELGEPLPWVLDDLNDPKIGLDARKRISQAIDTIEEELNREGIKKGTDDYEEAMAVGLYHLVAVPDAKIIFDKGAKVFDKHTKELVKFGLEEYKEFLKVKGGLRVKIEAEGENLEEYSALEALRNKKGECTELSKILYAVFRMAGLKPEFIYVRRENIRVNNPEKQRYIDTLPEGGDHMCVGLQIKGKLRLFDPTLIESDAKHNEPIILNQRQYLPYDFLNRGQVNIAKGKLDEALALVNRAIYINSRNAEAYTSRGVIWIKKGELDKAFSDLNISIKIDPNYAWAYNDLGAVWFEKGDYDRAIKELRKAIKINPRLAAPWYALGKSWVRKGNLDEGIRNFDEAIRINPKHVNALIHRGDAWFKKEDWDKAIVDYRKALQINSNITNAYANLGLAFVMKDDPHEAIKNFTEVLKKAPPKIGLKLFRQIAVMSTNRWLSNARGAMQTFAAETEGENIAAFEAAFISIYSLWQARQHAISIGSLKKSFAVLSFKQKPSQSTKDFFTKMFDLMPPDMAKDTEVLKVENEIRRKVGLKLRKP